MSFEGANIVWLKRDLRLQDHEALHAAAHAGGKVLLLYVLEPSLMSDAHYSERHWRFVQESIEDMRQKLEPWQGGVLIMHCEVPEAFHRLMKVMDIRAVYSHEETGLAITYRRDRYMSDWFDAHDILWQEFQNNGVIRGLRDRSSWKQDWYRYMSAAVPELNLGQIDWINPAEEDLKQFSSPFPMISGNKLFQPGGSRAGHAYLNSFLKERVGRYVSSISSPSKSREGCSRISPYLAWGCLSVRQVYQAQKASRQESPSKRGLQGFASRLRWQAHFIQKFEMEDRMETESINRGLGLLDKPLDREKVSAWEEGRTGYPLVDACMRCLQATGYINFRMRAMLVSFLTHHLWQPWQAGTHHLARLFLDFEPGIHYPQFQMQAGMTGINTIRIYNPVKQAEDHDSEALFIKKWLPELDVLPAHFAREPWTMTEMEAMMYGFEKGQDYPAPIVDIQQTAKHAREAIWAMRKSDLSRSESARILAKHTIPGRRNE